MNFCRNFVEICAFCIGFASGTASTRACRVDQLNIKQQRAANIFLHCLTYFDLKALRENFTFSLDVVQGCRRQEQSEPLEGDNRWQEQLPGGKGFRCLGCSVACWLAQVAALSDRQGEELVKRSGELSLQKMYKLCGVFTINASSLPSMLEDGTFKL